MGNHEKTEGRQTPMLRIDIKGKPNNTVSNLNNMSPVPTLNMEPSND